MLKEAEIVLCQIRQFGNHLFLQHSTWKPKHDVNMMSSIFYDNALQQYTLSGSSVECNDQKDDKDLSI